LFAPETKYNLPGLIHMLQERNSKYLAKPSYIPAPLLTGKPLQASLRAKRKGAGEVGGSIIDEETNKA
jgi:CRISPR/Cas system-associated endonuclease Cas3-HD